MGTGRVLVFFFMLLAPLFGSCPHSSDCFAGHNSQKLEPSCFVLFAVLGVNCAASSGRSLVFSFLHRSANTREASSVLFVPE